MGFRFSSSRIIPARAGFTFSPFSLFLGRRDHPRSRGVYRLLKTIVAWLTGSSPLARGLLSPPPACDARHRIIPARAGFTTVYLPKCHNIPDHPRSRGVYTYDTVRVGDRVGSSPLARGLLGGGRASLPWGRIIPARAGFTPSDPSTGPSSSDHPRSRGVYGCVQMRRGGYGGSSPLARGLRVARGVPGDAVGIIPARAGFTPRAAGRRRTTWDHPRSRGVYTCESLESQRTRSLPDPRCLHCRPRARSAELR